MNKKTQLRVELISGDRKVGETNVAVIACNDWLRLGTGRSLTKLLSKYADMPRNAPPTASLDTLKSWSVKFEWQQRATAFDADWEARKNAERAAVMDCALALDYERVNKLLRLAEVLEGELYERDADGNLTKVWLPDVKSIGSGENAERVDIHRFNSALLEQYRATLDDIAKEVGGRIRKQHVELDFTKLSDEELQRIAEGGG